MLINRRTALTGLAAGLSLTVPFPLGSLALANAGGTKRFVFVILRGGVDGLAMVEPRGDAAFDSLRGRLASANPLRLDGYFALHPSLPFVHGLYTKGQVRVHHATGTGYAGRSHFDAQNILETGGDRPFARDSGWLNRLLPLLPKQNGEAIAVGQNVPLALSGPTAVGSYKLSKLPTLDDDLLDRIEQLYVSDTEIQPIWDKAKSLPLTASPEEGAGNQSVGAVAASLLVQQAGARIATIELTGWDTHASQNARLSGKLRELDGVLADLHKGLGPIWDETLVLVASEFGRTAAVNGTNGTDHGQAGVALWLGGRLGKGGTIVSDWPGLSQQSLFENRDLRTTQLLQPVIAGSLAAHFALPIASVNRALF